MNKIPLHSLLAVLLIVSSLSISEGQTVALYYGDPNGSLNDAFDGNVFQAGNQYGDATIYAVLSGGANSFQIASPGESLTRTVSSTGYFTVRPTTNITIDKSKILNFSGTVTGSIAITVKPLSITTLSANVATETSSGSELTVSYRTGAGTFPAELTVGKFNVQLLDANGNYLYDLLNATDQYIGNEKPNLSRGGTRSIKATIPNNTPSGIYRVRVVTRGLNTLILGSSSDLFSIRDNTPVIGVGSVGTANFCAGTIVSFPFSTTGIFPSGNMFRVRLIDVARNFIQDLTETTTTTPLQATLPSALSGGTYRYQIVSTSTNIISATSVITITALPTMTIKGNSSIIAGSQAAVQISFTGTPPWSVSYVDYQSGNPPNYISFLTTSSTSLSLAPTLFFTTAYDKSFVKDFRDAGCGISNAINGSAQITVTPITLTTGSLSTSFCPGSVISVPFTTNSPLPVDAICQVQLSDINGNFQNGTIIGTGGRTSPVSATLPQIINSGTGYRLQITLQKPAFQGAVNYNDAISQVPTSLSISRPDVPKVADITFCSGAKLNSLTATGLNLKWYIDANTQPLPNAPIPPNDRSSRYFVSQTVNGCESALVAINAVQKQTPSVPVVSSTTLCQGGQGQFSATLPGILWYTTSTGGSGTSQPPVLNNQIAGDQVVYVTQTIDGCESPRGVVKATVYSIPAAPLVEIPAPLCQYSTTTALLATGQYLTWYDQSGKLNSAPVPETSTTNSKSYSVSQRVNGCESPLATISVIIRAAPSSPTVISVRYCVGDTPRSLTAIGTNLKWYTTPTGGSGSASSPAYFTETSNVLTFYVTQTDINNCESLRQPVSVSIVANPSAPLVTPNQSACQFSKVTSLTASPNTGLLWQGPGIMGVSDIPPAPATDQPGTFVYSVIVKAGTCSSPASAITFTVRKLPDAPQVISPVNLCIGQATKPLTATASGQLNWYTSANHDGSALTTVSPITTKAGVLTYYVTQKDAFNCESPNTPLDVRISTKTTATLTGDGEINVGDSTAIRVRLTGDGPWQFTNWTGAGITTNDSLYVKWEKPKEPRLYTYSIQGLIGACGAGEIKNNYTLIVRAPLSVQSLTEPIVLKAYPNPTTGNLTVDWNAPTSQAVSLLLISIDGKLIRQTTQHSTNIVQTEQFQLHNQPAGMYFLRLTTSSNGVLTQLIIKE